MSNKEISTKDNLQILHEDNHIIVINKRVGDIVQGDKTGDKPLSDVVKEYIRNAKNLLGSSKKLSSKRKRHFGSFLKKKYEKQYFKSSSKRSS